MQNLIAIGECSLDILFPGAEASNPSLPLSLKAFPADPVFVTAVSAAKSGLHVSYVSDAARDAIGDLLVANLNSFGIDTSCIDRFADGGSTPSNFRFQGSDAMVANRHYPAGERFNSPWPHINHGDMVVFGANFAIDDRSRQQVAEIITYATERKCCIIYLPVLEQCLVPRITRVMPALLEALEMSTIVVATAPELSFLFGEDSPRGNFERHLRFHCPTLLCAHNGKISIFQRANHAEASLPGNPSTPDLAAALTSLMSRESISPEQISNLTPIGLQGVVNSIAQILNDK